MATEEALKNELNILFSNNNVTDEIIVKIDKTIKKTKLVLSGGGIKGVAHIGALKALEELKILESIDTFAGASIGAVIAALAVIGYTPDELQTFINMMDFSKLKCLSLSNLLKSFGLDDGRKMEIVLEKLFSGKGFNINTTFKQLNDKTKKTLIISVSCLNDKKVYYFSHKTAPDMQVLTAIRMSISLPIFFVPVRHNGKLYVDGGCIDNFPMQLFHDCLDEVIGLYLADAKDSVNEINNIEDFLLNIVQCLLEGVTCNSLKGFEKQTIKICLSNISVVDFSVDKKMKTKLYTVGYNTVKQYCD